MIDKDDHSTFAAQWERWHRDHELRRARPHGFLAVTGMHWLDAEPRQFDDAPGSWSCDDDGVRVQLADGEELVVDDRRVRDAYRFDDVDELGIRASFGDAIVEICRRNEHFMIRPRHPDHAIRTGYRGTPTYPANTDWVVRGRLTPYDRPETVTVAASAEGLTHVYESPGVVDFVLAGQSLRLIAFNGEESGELFLVFTDATSGVTTYPACRFLDVDPPGPDNHVTLDFNRATNPPCAYTDFATCPLPPSGNHLPVRVEAGERLPLATP